MKSNYHAALAKIHIGAKAVGWIEPDDMVINPDTGIAETYREMLERITGSTSTRGQSPLKLAQVLTYFERKHGWKPVRPKKKTNKNWRASRIKYIRSLWDQLGALSLLDKPGDDGLKAFCNTMMRGNDINFALSHELNNIIEALKSWLKRATR